MSPATRLATRSEPPTSCMRPGTLVSERRSSSGSGRTVGYGPRVNGDMAAIAGNWSSRKLLDVPPDDDRRWLVLRRGSPTSRSPCGCHQDSDGPDDEIASSGNL